MTGVLGLSAGGFKSSGALAPVSALLHGGSDPTPANYKHPKAALMLLFIHLDQFRL